MRIPRRNYRNNRNESNFFTSFIILVLGIIFLMIISKNYYGEPVATFEEEADDTAAVFSSADEEVENTALDVDEKYLPTIDNVNRIKNFEDIRKYLYTIDETAYADEKLLDINELLKVDVKTDIGPEPKILIFHTHSQEEFKDSREGEVEDTIVGVGSELADILAKEYGIGVVHDFGQYDVVDGRTERGASYERMELAVGNILEKYPSIEIVLDLHRDGVREDMRLVTDINGEEIAQIMFFNGVVCEKNGGEGRVVETLPNPYLNENLGFSLKMQLMANELYPGLARKIYLKPYRYSLHMKPKSLLIEVGANTNTVSEAKNAMKYLAEILYGVIGQEPVITESGGR